MERASQAGAADGEVERDLFIEARAYLALRGRRLAAGPELTASWERFYAEYAPMVRRFVRARGVTEDDEHDCNQEVWRGVIQALAEGRAGSDPRRLRPWLLGMARNKAVDLARRRARTPKPEGEALIALIDPRATDPADSLERSDLRACLREAVVGLEHRVAGPSYKAFVLRWAEGLSHPEIARALGLTPAQVRARVHRVAKELRRSIGPWGKSSTGPDREGHSTPPEKSAQRTTPGDDF